MEAWLQKEPSWKNLKSQARTGNGTGRMHALKATQWSSRHLQCPTLKRSAMPGNRILRQRSLMARDCRLRPSEPTHGQALLRAKGHIEHELQQPIKLTG